MRRNLGSEWPGAPQRPRIAVAQQVSRAVRLPEEKELTYAVPGAQLALQAPAPLAGHTRRFLIVFIALALALTLVAIEAPGPVQARASSGGNEAARVIRFAKSHLGAKFRLGTEGMRYFDCSGFVFRSFTQAGLIKKIGGKRMRAVQYYNWFKKRGLVSRSNPKMGDLIIWGNAHHIGIYIKPGQAISALTSGVRTHHLNTLDYRFKAFLHVPLKR